MKSINFIVFILLSQCFLSCTKQDLPDLYTSQKVIIIVVDGARYSETWGEETKQYIPHLSGEMAQTGVLYSNFFNDEFTYTLAGHTAITTGIYQEIENKGDEWPEFPSIFQYFNNKFQRNDRAYIIASKDKLEILAHCKNNPLLNIYSPMVDVGINGLGSGYRHDSITLNHALEILSGKHPNLLLLSFREPDYSAHQKNWDAYLDGIKNTDQYIYKIWKFIQTDSIYKDKTTLIVTNDHGRHLDNVEDGFVSHGDTCLGCRHISLFACGPNIKKGVVIETKRKLTDIPFTVAQILGIPFKTGNGEVMNEMFINK